MRGRIREAAATRPLMRVRSFADSLEEPQFRPCRIELQSARNAFMRVAIQMALVPLLVADAIRPVREEPELRGILDRPDDLHPLKARGRVDQVRALDECIAHRILHSIRDAKTA